MSNQRALKIVRTLPYTATYLNGVLTVTTQTAHYLLSNDNISLHGYRSQAVMSIANKPVTVVNATSFTIDYLFTDESHALEFLKGIMETSVFRAGVTGRFSFSLGKTTGSPIVIQSFVIGTGGASYTLDVSLDNEHWTNVATVTHIGTTGDTQSAQIAPVWVYGSIDITSIGAATSLTILHSV